MNKEITSVDALLSAVREEPPEPGRRTLDHKDSVYGMKSPTWGPSASLDAGDVGSRLGIDMGEPTVKAAALRHALLYDEAASLEKLALASTIIRGAKAVGSVANKAMDAVSRGGQASRKWFAGRRAADLAKSRSAAAARRGAHETATQGLTGARKGLADLGFKGKEVVRKAPGLAMGVGGTALTVGEVSTGTRDWRLGGRGASGHGT